MGSFDRPAAPPPSPAQTLGTDVLPLVVAAPESPPAATTGVDGPTQGPVMSLEALAPSWIEKATDILLLLDHTGAFRYVSPSVRRILGYTPEEVLGLLAIEFVHPSDVSMVSATISAALAQPGVSQRLSAYRVRRSDGSWCFFEAVTTSLLEEATVRGIAVTCHDITERKSSERVLIERARLSKLEADIAATLAGGGNLAMVLDRALTLISGALQAPVVRLWTYERESRLLELRGAVGPFSLAGDASLAVMFPVRAPLGASLAGEIGQHRQPYESSTLSEDSRFDEARDRLQAEGLVAFAGYPMILEDQLVGVLALLGRSPFTSAERGALGWIANMLAVGIDRAWAREELVSQREALLFRLAAQIGTALEIEAVLQAAVRDVRSLLHVDRCLFAWFQPQPASPRPSALKPEDLPLEGSYWQIASEAVAKGITSRLNPCLTGSAVALAPVLLQWGSVAVECSARARIPAARDFLAALDARAGAVVLVLGQQAGAFGALCCLQESAERSWSESELHLLRGVAGQLAIALDRAALYNQARERAERLETTLLELRSTQLQLIQTEKMSGLGRLVAGVAHEINNPIAFVHGNLTYARQYLQELFTVLEGYRGLYPNPPGPLGERLATLDLEFVKTDFAKLLDSMQMGAERIRQIVLSLKNFSRRGDRIGMRPADLHAAIDNVLLILQHRLNANELRSGIELLRNFGELPMTPCQAGQIEQALMNIISNAIDALEELTGGGCLTLSTQTVIDEEGLRWAEIAVADNGPGMDEETRTSLFDPFFTTKPVGKGTGLGLSIAYQIIVETHKGRILCDPAPYGGTIFRLQLPLG